MENTLKKLRDQIDLSFEETKVIFGKIMSGEVSEDEMHEFLTLLSNKGEVSSEIAAGVYVLRDKSRRVNVEGAIDTCGTGGDGPGIGRARGAPGGFANAGGRSLTGRTTALPGTG